MKNVRLFRGGFAIFIALLGATPLVSLAQVWSTGPNGQMGYYTTPNPISPDCKAPLVWTLTNGHYTCQRPQQPICQSGYNTVSAATWTGSGWTQPVCVQPAPPSCPPGQQASSAATWNGSSWVGLVCVPIVTTPPALTGVPACEAAAVSDGYQITQGFNTYPGPFPYPGGVGAEEITYGANGPVTYDTCGDSTTQYLLGCVLNVDGTLAYLAVVEGFFPSCSGNGN